MNRKSTYFLLALIVVLGCFIFVNLPTISSATSQLLGFFAWLWNAIEDKEKAKFLLEFAKFVATVLGATVVLLNIKIAWDNRTLAEEQIDTATFSKSIDQLASPSMTTRLGGVFTLEKIARYSKDYSISMGILASFLKEVQEQGRSDIKPEKPTGAQKYRTFSTEFLTVMKVIERRRKEFDRNLPRLLDLSGIDLSRANLENRDFSHLDLQFSNFHGSNLLLSKFSNADLSGVNFSSADLSGVDFLNADLKGADFSDAILVRANLESADLTDSKLENADLSDAKLKEAKLYNANLQGACLLGTDVTDEQIATAGNTQGIKR